VTRTLLSVVELGGYPSFTSRYQAAGFEVVGASSMRKAIALVKRSPPDVVVAEFNFQSDFRDRTSNLESLLATLQARAPKAKVVVFYEPQRRAHLERLLARFPLFAALPFPIEEGALGEVLARAAG
jgi:DNA-binding NarL/FixJ family response regulator